MLLCNDQNFLRDKENYGPLLMERVEEITDNFQRIRGLLLSTVSSGVGPIVEHAKQIYLSNLSISNAIHANNNKKIILFEPRVFALPDTLLPPSKNNGQEIPLKEGYSQEIIEEAKRFINQNFERSITLQDVAEHIHFNPNYLSSLFRKATGKNYIHYLTDCRMQQAIKLLQQSTYKVYEISEMVGYSTPAYFINLFRKHTGHTPHEFRSIQDNKRGMDH